MLTSKRVLTLMALGLMLGSGVSQPLNAQENAANFLRHVNSARANGMGACVVTMTSEESAYYNPASVGLFHLDKTVSFVAPHYTKWLPTLTDDLRLKSWSASACVSRKPFKGIASGRSEFAVGLSFSHTKLSYGTFVVMSPTGEVLSRHETYDAANCLAIGFGYRHKVRIGFGYAIKFIDSRLGEREGAGNADGTAHQLGLMLELPINELTAGDASSGRTALQVTPTMAFVLDNLGNKIAYTDAAQSDKLPKMSRVGISVLMTVASDNKEYCSIRGSLESEKLLVGDVSSQAKAGLEVGVLRAFYLRVGQFESEARASLLPTYGVGLRLRGLLNGGRLKDAVEDDRGFGAYFARHFDLSADYARYGNPGDHGFSKTWFYAISVSL